MKLKSLTTEKLKAMRKAKRSQAEALDKKAFQLEQEAGRVADKADIIWADLEDIEDELTERTPLSKSERERVVKEIARLQTKLNRKKRK